MSAKEIADLRNRLGLSRTELAARLGLTESAIHYWEHGERKPSGPALILLHQLADQAAGNGNGHAAANGK